MRCILSAITAVVVIVGSTHAQEKKFDSAKLVGKWELTKSESGNAPKGAIVEFTKDNKLTISGTEKDGTKFEIKGTYKVEGDKLVTTLKAEGKEATDTDTITSLTDEKLVLLDNDKKVTELTKKK